MFLEMAPYSFFINMYVSSVGIFFINTNSHSIDSFFINTNIGNT